MLSESLDSQVSGNTWSHPPAPMLYQEFQQVAAGAELWEQRDLLRDLERDMAAFEVEHETALNELRRLYIFPADSSVTGFLRAHRIIPQLLVLAAQQLKTYFGADTVFTLRASVDESGSRTLCAVAIWPGSVKDAKTALDRFDDSWWIANSRQALGDLYFTYELV
jgi:hypothetical protein